MVDRRGVLGATALLAGCAATGQAGRTPAPSGFVRRDGTRFTVDGRPYRYAGANLWYGAWLAADAPYGNRARLARELDRLQALGVTNLRILASAEEGPLKASIKPGFRDRGTDYNQTLLTGLDWLLAEMGRRNMRAVLYLTNFWEWSGGIQTYLYYVTGRYIDMNDPAHPWPAFPNANAAFYRNARAVTLYHDYIRAVVGRTNSVTGRAYRDDPTVMAWQLANEPRPAGDGAHADLPAFYGWVDGTAKLIKTIDPNHLVSTGSEGLKGCLEKGEIVLAEHQFPSIDYLTVHIWPLNWSWVDDKDLPGTADAGARQVDQYLRQHVALATQLGKPMVIEEFGYPRDTGGYDPALATTHKDRFYHQIYRAALDSARSGGPIAGTNFWAWNGEGRAQHPDWRFRPGDLQYLGDPPHEPQGWYGVFDTDASTAAIIREHAAAMAAIG